MTTSRILTYWRDARRDYVDYFGKAHLPLPVALARARDLACVEIDWAIICLEAAGDDPERVALVLDLMPVRFGGVPHDDVVAMLLEMLRVTRELAGAPDGTD